jgi:succinate dehydrogenase / fumarate reductase iron-sulfur subunit
MKLFQIQRYSPAEGKSSQEYRLELKEAASVLDALHTIRAEHDATLAYRFSCRSSVCGSCAMWINGRPRLACQTKVDQLNGEKIVVAPLRGLPIIKDLVVDMQPLWDAYQKVMPWLVEKKNAKDMVITKKTSDVIERFYACILCAACFASCPEACDKRSYLGPMPLMDGYRMYLDPRDKATAERKRILGGPDGVWGCHGAFACIDACPWDAAPVEFIADLRLKLVKGQFGGR